MSATTMHRRLSCLEQRHPKTDKSELVLIIGFGDGDLPAEQQAEIDKAHAEGREVVLIHVVGAVPMHHCVVDAVAKMPR